MDDQIPVDIITKFYADNNLPADGGVASRVVHIGIGKYFSIYFPNFNARRKALVKHDVHHIVTGYTASSFLGEAEISAWEISSGCKKYWAALIIDTHGALLGLWINPWKVLKAFARGRKTTNLYHDTLTREEELYTSVGELKKILKLDQYGQDTRPKLVDLFWFGIFVFVGGIYSILSIGLLPFIIVYSIYIRFKK